MINSQIRASYWMTFPQPIVNFNHFFIQPAPGFWAFILDITHCMEEFCRLRFRVRMFIHFLDLSRNSCEKYNYSLSGRDRTCGPAIPVKRSITACAGFVVSKTKKIQLSKIFSTYFQRPNQLSKNCERKHHFYPVMDHSPINQNFDLNKSRQNSIIAWKSITKLVIFQSFVAKCCKMRII
jgi:hypothetical protein